jgi:predicted PurR-regulated permease PerM
MNRTPPNYDMTRITLGVLLILALMGSSLWVVRPFLPATVWAAMVVIATWPLMKQVEARLWGKRSLAVVVMTIAFLLVLIVPLWVSVGTLVEHADDIASFATGLATQALPQPPAWVENLPLVGTRIADTWREFVGLKPEEMTGRLLPYARTAGGWLAAQAGGVGMMLVHFLLTALIAAILYANGEAGATSVLRFARRVAGDRGENAAILAAKAVRAVALGVVVTALVQSVLAGIGLWISGVPYAGVLTAVIFIACIAQIGPTVVLVPCVVWLYWKGDPVWGTVLLVWTLIVGFMDNFLRPFLIKRGADLPLLLILVGVIGGLLSFGVIGLFVGPVLLAVTYTLLQSWVSDIDRPAPSSEPPTRES